MIKITQCSKFFGVKLTTFFFFQNMFQKMYVIYDENEENAKVVAGHPHYYELECKTGGYVARATAAAFAIG